MSNFDAWRDNHGHTHAGFRQNLLLLRQALVDQINQPDLTPNTFAPMTSDEQDPKARVQFHFDAWRDNHGHTHAGFRQNLLLLRQALVDQINQPDLTPNTFAPMTSDFVGR